MFHNLFIYVQYYLLSSKGLKDEHGNEVHKFDHPWFQTGLMFIGETMCLIGLFFHRRRERLKFKQNLMSVNRDEGSSGDASTEIQQQPRVFQWIFAFPTVCDLFGTTLGGIGLLYVNASVWQMLRGSIIIFTGVLSKIFLKRKLWPIHWIGMIVTMFGLVLVGLSSVLRDNHQGTSQGQVVLGIVFILAGQSVSDYTDDCRRVILEKKKVPSSSGQWKKLCVTDLYVTVSVLLRGTLILLLFHVTVEFLCFGNFGKLIILHYGTVYLLSVENSS
ncbi:hypothetical protein OS493_035444 [Desmophyllum pertusum]|uniref:Solute carrier family 35 member F6 n=1 Tax=Desmophyllum pertusum TaxID=174260 RepID=A0A9W9ZIN5_9CNID|nr:hypothetical protein OS493_035444 [Desmophyllum pertusum]